MTPSWPILDDIHIRHHFRQVERRALVVLIEAPFFPKSSSGYLRAFGELIVDGRKPGFVIITGHAQRVRPTDGGGVLVPSDLSATPTAAIIIIRRSTVTTVTRRRRHGVPLVVGRVG